MTTNSRRYREEAKLHARDSQPRDLSHVSVRDLARCAQIKRQTAELDAEIVKTTDPERKAYLRGCRDALADIFRLLQS